MGEAEAIVFIVDDDESLRRALSRLLRSAGYRVESFADAAAYLARESHSGPGCLLLDLAMPGIDGLQLQQRLAEEPSALPVVFLSGHAQVPQCASAMKSGAVDFLTKPVDEELLLAAVRKAVAQRDACLQRGSRVAGLSAREREVMYLVAAGLRNKETARRLGISEKTVKVHRARVMEKTGAATLPELVRLLSAEGPAATLDTK